VNGILSGTAAYTLNMARHSVFTGGTLKTDGRRRPARGEAAAAAVHASVAGPTDFSN
jgi:hypothetical protein